MIMMHISNKIPIETLEALYGEDKVVEGFAQFKKVIQKEQPTSKDLVDYLSEWDMLR